MNTTPLTPDDIKDINEDIKADPQSVLDDQNLLLEWEKSGPHYWIVPHTRQARAKISKANSGEGNGNYGREFPPEMIENMSKAHKGQKRPDISIRTSGERNPNYGRHHSDEIKQELSDIRILWYETHEQRLSPEHREALLQANIGKPCSEEKKSKIAESNRRWWDSLTPAQKEEYGQARRKKPGKYEGLSKPRPMIHGQNNPNSKTNRLKRAAQQG